MTAARQALGDLGAGPQRRATELLRQAALAEVERRLTENALADLGAALHRGELSLAEAADQLLIQTIRDTRKDHDA